MFGLGTLVSAACSLVSSACSAACSLCSKIGGGVMSGISSLVSKIIGPNLGPNVEEMVNFFVKVISFLAEYFSDKPKEEEPEEIGMKAEQAEKAGKKPDDFDSINEYIEYLRNEIQLDSDKMKKLSDEERLKYQLVGSGLYIRDVEEKQGLTLAPDFLESAIKLKEQGYTEMDIANLMQSMKNNGVTDAKQYVDFLKGDLQPGTPERHQVYASVKDMVEQHFKGEEVNMREKINKLADTVRE